MMINVQNEKPQLDELDMLIDQVTQNGSAHKSKEVKTLPELLVGFKESIDRYNQTYLVVRETEKNVEDQRIKMGASKGTVDLDHAVDPRVPASVTKRMVLRHKEELENKPQILNQLKFNMEAQRARLKDQRDLLEISLERMLSGAQNKEEMREIFRTIDTGTKDQDLKHFLLNKHTRELVKRNLERINNSNTKVASNEIAAKNDGEEKIPGSDTSSNGSISKLDHVKIESEQSLDIDDPGLALDSEMGLESADGESPIKISEKPKIEDEEKDESSSGRVDFLKVTPKNKVFDFGFGMKDQTPDIAATSLPTSEDSNLTIDSISDPGTELGKINRIDPKSNIDKVANQPIQSEVSAVEHLKKADLPKNAKFSEMALINPQGEVTDVLVGLDGSEPSVIQNDRIEKVTPRQAAIDQVMDVEALRSKLEQKLKDTRSRVSSLSGSESRGESMPNIFATPDGAVTTSEIKSPQEPSEALSIQEIKEEKQNSNKAGESVDANIQVLSVPNASSTQETATELLADKKPNEEPTLKKILKSLGRLGKNANSSDVAQLEKSRQEFLDSNK